MCILSLNDGSFKFYDWSIKFHTARKAGLQLKFHINRGSEIYKNYAICKQKQSISITTIVEEVVDKNSDASLQLKLVGRKKL